MAGFSGVKKAVERKKGLDATVGGLVWVQRKNGSWWPGQVVGTEELSVPDLATPRSGTPIKLLGREDTSVDWYDFEVTKVVKPFRCGEYDACIQKAEISAANNLLKFTKYPRRENAIVCALEIEKKILFEDDPATDALLNCEKGSGSPSHSAKDGDYSPEKNSSEERVGACEGNSNSTQELSHSGISFEGTNGLTHVKEQHLRGRKCKTLNDSEDDGYDGAKRMKGLNDLGSVPEKKVQVLALPSATSQISPSCSNLNGASGLSMETLSNGSPTPAAKRKRSQVVHLHEFLKRSFQRRSSTKVLENTSMVPVPIICDEFANPFERYDAVSPFYDCENSDKVKDAELSNGLLPEDDSSDILFDVPFFDEKHASGISSSWHSSLTKSHNNSSGCYSSLNTKVQASFHDCEALDESAPFCFSSGHANQIMEKSASEWQSKGKRNARHMSKADDSYSIKNADSPESSRWFSPGSNGLVNGFLDSSNRISTSSPRSFPSNQPCFVAHSNSEMADVSPRSIHTDSVLYEVEVTVEATRPQVQHVPYISLMSKLNGKPITGHPIAVEVLVDGFVDLQTSDYPANSSCELEDEDTEIVKAVEPNTHRVKKEKNRPRIRPKRSKCRKRHGSSSKKTRKLSSLTGAQKLGLVKSKPMSQNSKGPTLACVPLKVVFSRINEALSGSRSAHHSNNT